MIVACLPLAGVAGQYLINPQLSHLELYWQMIGVREYHARLSAVQGEINFDQQQDSQIRLQARLPIAALDANNWLLTRALKSAAFFDQEKYPEAVFSSNRGYCPIAKDRRERVVCADKRIRCADTRRC